MSKGAPTRPAAGAIFSSIVMLSCGATPHVGEVPGSGRDSVGSVDHARVTRVIDGDTVEVSYRGRDLDVRLIGIDTPETVAPGQGIECFGPAASRFTERALEGKDVRLEFDVERLDRYGRTLAYVWIGGELFNEILCPADTRS